MMKNAAQARGRGFWLHQIVEYLISAALILMSAQSDYPLVTSAFGVALLINVTITDGPLSASKLFRAWCIELLIGYM